MSDLHELEPPAVRRDGKARVFDLQSRREIHLLPTTTPLSQAHERGPQNDRSENELANETRTLDQQIAHMEKIAMGHYPDDERARLEYFVQLLTQRLREYHAKVTPLTVREM